MLTAQVCLGLIRYGEIGSTLGRGLRQSGLVSIAAYDKCAFDGPFADPIQRRAREVGVTLVNSPAELAEDATLILGVTPGSASIGSAVAFAPHLTPAHVFLDVASATPNVKQAVARELAASKARPGDASILGTPRDGHRLPILTSGPAAQSMRDQMVPCGMNITLAGPEIGAASGIKILRSVVMKGLEALVLECVLGARHDGVDTTVLTPPGKALSCPFSDTVNALLTTTFIHAARRAEEAAMSAEALADAGIEPLVTRAVAERLEWVARRTQGTPRRIGAGEMARRRRRHRGPLSNRTLVTDRQRKRRRE